MVRCGPVSSCTQRQALFAVFVFFCDSSSALANNPFSHQSIEHPALILVPHSGESPPGSAQRRGNRIAVGGVHGLRVSTGTACTLAACRALIGHSIDLPERLPLELGTAAWVSSMVCSCRHLLEAGASSRRHNGSRTVETTQVGGGVWRVHPSMPQHRQHLDVLEVRADPWPSWAVGVSRLALFF
jgi:hypothetical protein